MKAKDQSPAAGATMEVEMVAIGDLVPFEKNSRVHPPGQIERLAAAIDHFGFRQPILIDANNGIVAGHGRMIAAVKLGMTTLPCIRVRDLSETQIRAFVIADNKLSEMSAWDDEALAAELEALAEAGMAELSGFDADEVATIVELPQVLRESTEDLRPLKWTRILVSIPNGIEVPGLADALQRAVAHGVDVDYGSN